jgi:ABC-type bacteriocin/lantibiotic exporter with double-glycine peptidase domain
MVNVFGNMLIACMGITFVLSIMPSIARATSASRMLLSVILRKPQQSSGNSKLDIIKGEVEFKDVRFEYPTRPGQAVLRDFNLKITPGQKIALVGRF